MAAPLLVLAAHTLSGVMPGDTLAARHDLRVRLAAASAAGFAGICVHLRDYAALRQSGWSDAAVREAFAAVGLSVPAIEFLPDWHHQTDEAALRRDLAFEAARALGAPVITAGLDALGDAPDLDALAAPLGDLCERAQAQGLRIALEPVAWGQGKRLQDALSLIDKSGGQAGLLIDIWHLAWRAIPPADLCLIPPALVLGLQISDSAAPHHGDESRARVETLRRKPCGQGALDIGGYLGVAAACGWTAPIAVEIIAPEFAAFDVAKAAACAYDTASPYVTSAWS